MGQPKRHKRPILLIEQLDLLTLPVWACLAWWYGGGYFVGWSRVLRLTWLRRLLTRLTRLHQVRYEQFPGSYFEVQRVTAESANDALYEWACGSGAAPVIAFLRRLRDHEFMEVALRRALQEVYTLGRVKTLVMLRELTCTNDRVVFFPRDNCDPLQWMPAPWVEVWGRPSIPRLVRFTNLVKFCLEALAVLGYAALLIAYLVVQRRLVLAPPTLQHWRVGFDVYDEGVNWDKPYHESFLYDDQALAPQSLLHVVRRRLKDPRTRQHFQEKGIPFVESSRVPISLGYLLRRLLWEFYGGLLRLALGQSSQKNNRPFLWAGLLVLQNLIRAEILETSYRTSVFVTRDEYSVMHIVRTLIYDQRSGTTVGFSHGDDPLPQVANSYRCCHVFCFPGLFHQRLLGYNSRFSRKTCIIGAGVYGLDETFQLMQTGVVPPKYAELRKRHRIVGVFSSTFAEDFFLTREMTIRFYRTVLNIPERYPDVLLVVRPKGDEFKDPELRLLLAEAGPRVILEDQEWTYNLLPIFDLMLCIAISSVGLEGLMAGRRVIYFDDSGFREHPYQHYDPCLVARSPEELVERVDQVLGRGQYVPAAVLAKIRSYHGFQFDGNVVNRLRKEIYTALASQETRPKELAKGRD